MRPSASVGLLQAKVAQIRKKYPNDRRPIGVRLAAPWTGPLTALRVENEEIPAVYCPSPLAFRARLAEHAGSAVVLLTDRSELELGADVRLRLVRRKLFTLDSWQALRDRFAVQQIDPRLRSLSWLPDYLLALGEEELPRPAGQALDADEVWPALLRRLGLADPLPDLRALLEWTASPGGPAAFLGLPAEARADHAKWIARSAGEAAEAILRLVEAGRGGETVAAGLICALLFSARPVFPAAADAEIARAAGRLEALLLGGSLLSPAAGLAWAEAAGGLARRRLAAEGEAAILPWLSQAQRLAEELRIEDLATAESTWLPSALGRTVKRFAVAVSTWLDRPEGAALPELSAAAARVRRHELAPAREPEMQAVDMVLRLCRWLAASAGRPPAGSFAEAAALYEREGSWVDRARAVLDAYRPGEPLAAAGNRLLRDVAARREAESRRFAELLAQWSEAPTATRALVPVESALDRVVVPLARQSPVLLLVLDGLSFAIFHELTADLAKSGWDEMRPRDVPARLCAAGLLPTVTQVCRTSLFCGDRRTGTAATEAEGFAAHAGLRQQGSAGLPPVLFHKADLGSGGGLAEKVRDEIARPGRRVVGVVLNAVDDQLPKGGQMVPRWRVSAIRFLGELLQGALTAGRAIVLTADHGHLVERETRLQRHEGGGARYRPLAPGAALGEGEIAIRGPRVLLGDGAGLVLAWSERLRYTAVQAGYHGGASPQEVLVPLSVWVPAGSEIPEWEPVAGEPDWWQIEEVRPSETAAASPTPQTFPKPVTLHPSGQRELFPAPLPAPAGAAEPWLAALFSSPAYHEQKRQAARQGLSDEKVAEVLLALAGKGGGMTPAALGRQLEAPLSRVHGLLAALQRLLNVEGFPVLVFDPGSDRVTLDQTLLAKQFPPGEERP